jgi:ubiquinone/menaquinone biosynthesis C-methylase UbiE
VSPFSLPGRNALFLSLERERLLRRAMAAASSRPKGARRRKRRELDLDPVGVDGRRFRALEPLLSHDKTMDDPVAYEDDALRSQEAITHFFDHSKSAFLWSLRSLCNGVKAALIEMSVHALREKVKAPRIRVLDIGSGKGGDLVKWARHRPKAFVGVDISEASVLEARERHISLLRSGRVTTPATFLHADVSAQILPLAPSSIEIASLQFSLQFMFRTDESALHAICEAHRVLVPGGILVGILPDGDRLAQEFMAAENTAVVVGHFLFRKFSSTTRLLSADPPAGIPYSFSLGSAEPCAEYLVLSSYLHHLLLSAGFAPALKSGRFSENAQAFYAGHDEARTTVASLLKGRWCSASDWDSLSSFRVFMARKPVPEEECTVEAAGEGGPPKAKPRKSRKVTRSPVNKQATAEV